MTADVGSRTDGWRRGARRHGATAQLVAMVPLVAIGVSAWLGLVELLPTGLRVAVSLSALPAVAVFVGGLLSGLVRQPTPPAPYPIRCPVYGRWSIVNGPGTKVPSHGTHLFAQTYAVDGACVAIAHLQVMDRPRPSRALGLPFTVTDAVVGDTVAPPAGALPGIEHLENGAFLHGGVTAPRTTS